MWSHWSVVPAREVCGLRGAELAYLFLAKTGRKLERNQIEILSERIRLECITCPKDGVVLSGNLSPSLFDTQ